jgi:seryl-tRNA synthetase
MAQFLPSTPNEVHLLQINNSLLAENLARTQNEQQLYSAWQQSEMDKKQMLTTIHDLNEQLKVIELEIEKLKLNQKPSEITLLEEINDLGDLAEDTKWVRV